MNRSNTAEAGTSAVSTHARQAKLRQHSPWLVFGVIALIEFMAVMDASIVNIALPTIRTELGFDAASVAWVVDGYLVGFAGFMLLAGRAADVLGRRRLFIGGVLLFTVFSVACALADTPWLLVTSRLLQGVGAAFAVPAALALITDLFAEGPSRNRALGIFAGMAGVAAPVGLVLGGLLTTIAWEWIFLINAPIGVAVIVAGLRLLPRDGARRADTLDVLGAVSITGGLALLILGMVRGNAQDWTAPSTLAELAGSVVLLLVFVGRQAFARQPLVPRGVLQDRTRVVGNLIFAAVGTILLSTFFLTTLYLQRVRGMDALGAAAIYLPLPIGMLIGTQLAPRLLQVGVRRVLAGGLLIQAATLGGWAVVMSPNANVLWTFMLPATVWAVGLGLAIVCSFVVCTQGLTGHTAGVASGLAQTTYQGGGAVGLAVLAVVADFQTRQHLGVSTDLADALTHGYSVALGCASGLALVATLLTSLLSSDGRS